MKLKTEKNSQLSSVWKLMKISLLTDQVFPADTIFASKYLKHGEAFIICLPLLFVYKETFMSHFGNISMLAAKKVLSE